MLSRKLVLMTPTAQISIKESVRLNLPTKASIVQNCGQDKSKSRNQGISNVDETYRMMSGRAKYRPGCESTPFFQVQKFVRNRCFRFPKSFVLPPTQNNRTTVPT